MSRCKRIGLLYDVLPLKLWRGYLIRHHIEKCPVCERKLIHKEELRPLLIKAGEVGDSGRLWPGIRAGLQSVPGKDGVPQSSAGARWRWALGAAGLLIAVLAGLWLYRGDRAGRIPSGDEADRKFQIQYMKIGDAPARPFVYQPQGTKIIIIWAEKTLNGG